MKNKKLELCQRDKLFGFAMNQLGCVDKWMEKIIFCHVYQLKVGGDYVINTKEELKDIVDTVIADRVLSEKC